MTHGLIGQDARVPEEVRYYANGYRLSLVCIVVLFQIIFLLQGLTSDKEGALFVGIALIVLLSALPVLRLVQGPSIRLGVQTVTIVGVNRTRRLAWTDIESVEVIRVVEMLPLPWRAPLFRLKGGEAVPAQSFRSLKVPSVVDDVIVAVTERLATQAPPGSD